MKHTFGEYIELLKKNDVILEVKDAEGRLDREVSYISYNSRDIIEDTLFVCKGVHFEPKYLEDAIKAGALAYVSEKEYETENVPLILVSDMRKALALIANFYYENVSEKLNTVGITGTKGKSTTTYFTRAIFDDYLSAEKKPLSAVLSGIDNYDGVINEESHLTTPETFELHKSFNNAVNSGIEYLTMEVSSQSLKYHRVMGVTYKVGCFLNIGTDHISDREHKDFNDYFQSKLKLFGQCKTACVNLDCDHATEVLERAKSSDVVERVIAFSTEDESADVYGYDISSKDGHVFFKVKTKDFDEEFEIGLPGVFNVSNALAAIANTWALGVPVEYMKSGLKRARVSGRMEVYSKDGKYVIVDYAHNKLSFETLFKAMKKEFPGKKLHIVFGCPGKKAYARRQELGELAGEYCDRVYITEEDAGEEDVLEISKEIESYVKKFDCREEIITDRVEAIEKAIDEIDSDTVLLITGKGRETRQKRGTEYIPTPSDVEVVTKKLGL